DAFHACARNDPARDIGIPRNSPTYGLPVLSSSCTGAQSPERSIWAKLGLLTSSVSRPTIRIARARVPMVFPAPSPEPLEVKLHRQLEHARRERRRDLAVGRGRAVRIRVAPLAPIEDVDRLEARFNRL